MSDRAYSLLLFIGLAAGPASAFLVDPRLLPAFILFPAAGLLGSGRKVSVRLLALGVAPAISLGWALWTSNPELTDRSLRWLAAVAAGASMAGALGTSRASALLHEASARLVHGGFLDSLSMVLALAGPYSSSVRADYLRCRSEGLGVEASFSASLSRLPDLEDFSRGSHSPDRCAAHIISSCMAWTLLLSGTAGLP